MAKILAKYFIAIVPEGTIQASATDLKLDMKQRFNLKYALKSPAHVTVKMPFSWNEKKEEKLVQKLTEFVQSHTPFEIHFHDFDRFGRRVIFVKVSESAQLKKLQSALSKFCKMELKQVEELSDKAYHPHMTIAFKDVKAKDFETYWEYIKRKKFRHSYEVKDIALLKRVEGRWEVLARFGLEGKSV